MPDSAGTGCGPHHTLLVMNSGVYAYFRTAPPGHSFHSDTLPCGARSGSSLVVPGTERYLPANSSNARAASFAVRSNGESPEMNVFTRHVVLEAVGMLILQLAVVTSAQVDAISRNFSPMPLCSCFRLKLGPVAGPSRCHGGRCLRADQRYSGE